MYRKLVKRPFDVIISLFGLLVLLLPLIIISIVIMIDSQGGIMFRQTRLGKHKELFTIYKFRTMIPHALEIGGTNTTNDDPRITRVGRFLRKSSMDELPQLINIIVGKMAIIGPRPILPFEFEAYEGNDQYSKRFDVLPGLFCSVDLDYRAQASRELQFEMDATYTENITFWGDVRLFFGVIKTVLLGANVYKKPPIDSKDKSNQIVEPIEEMTRSTK